MLSRRDISFVGDSKSPLVQAVENHARANKDVAPWLEVHQTLEPEYIERMVQGCKTSGEAIARVRSIMSVGIGKNHVTRRRGKDDLTPVGDLSLERHAARFLPMVKRHVDAGRTDPAKIAASSGLSREMIEECLRQLGGKAADEFGNHLTPESLAETTDKRERRMTKDKLMPVGDAGEAVIKYAKPGEGIAIPQARANDELPTAVKPVGLVPMPAGERNEESYAPRKATDAEPTVDEIKAEIKELEAKKKLSNVEYARLIILKKELKSKATDALLPVGADLDAYYKTHERSVREVRARASDVKYDDPLVADYARACNVDLTSMLKHLASDDWAVKQFEAWKRAHGKASDKAKATDGIIDPAVHLAEAQKYELAGQRARALDSYRAAASGFRRTGDAAKLALAVEGGVACQTVYAAQFQHPAMGRTRVCDSVEQALTSALSRTRAGESVTVDGRVVRPATARAKDESREAQMLRELKEEHGDKYSDAVLRESVKTGREPWSITVKQKAKDSENDDKIAELVARIKKVVKAQKADGTVSMSKTNLKQMVGSGGIRFANPNHFERAFSEALEKAGVSSFAKDEDIDSSSPDELERDAAASSKDSKAEDTEVKPV
jgi:hypothetical protein